jgi:hypothetical protein
MAQESAAVTPPKSNWRNIEPVLKWIGVAYAFGFLVVLVHTYRLGIPMLQLIEPVNVWIGAPLALLAFFLDKIFEGLTRAVRNLRASVKKAAEIRQDLSADPELFRYQVFEIWFGSLALFAAPIGLLGPAQKLLHRLNPIHPDLTGKASGAGGLAVEALTKADRERMLGEVEPILRWAQRIAVGARLINLVLLVFWAIVACGYYVELFPKIPQTLGGGRPQSVQLLLSPESIPQAKEFEDWRKEMAAPEAKQSILVPVTLYFHTEHELIVRKGTGPIVSLSDHAINGIVFPPPAASALP